MRTKPYQFFVLIDNFWFNHFIVKHKSKILKKMSVSHHKVEGEDNDFDLTTL